MMERGFFHPDRGYWQANSEPSSKIVSVYPEGTVEVPLMPSANHKWDGAQWVLRPQQELDAMAAAEVREQRSYLLAAEVDPIVSNPLRWADLSAEKQAAWATYRRALLDITAQAGFPHSVEWPQKPEETV
jgi:hypothetical protein